MTSNPAPGAGHWPVDRLPMSLNPRRYRQTMHRVVSIGVVGVILLLSWSVRIVEVSAQSMSTTILDGDRVLVASPPLGFLWSLLQQHIKRGQIVVLARPFGGDVVKRIVAVGGDRLRISGGNLYVNGRETQESYLCRAKAQASNWSWPMDQKGSGLHDIYVPPGHVFVLGDNRSESVDSRHWGAVPCQVVRGLVIAVIHHTGATTGTACPQRRQS